MSASDEVKRKLKFRINEGRLFVKVLACATEKNKCAGVIGHSK